ncbi:hypothetical protein [Priestia endophytica]|uniref:hypothetical protein n=1 Tax=Priestia endophytica TaxID=135735 RepID=UPI001559465D|nr:hypothetical protein [Priestia endophytica]
MDVDVRGKLQHIHEVTGTFGLSSGEPVNPTSISPSEKLLSIVMKGFSRNERPYRHLPVY